MCDFCLSTTGFVLLISSAAFTVISAVAQWRTIVSRLRSNTQVSSAADQAVAHAHGWHLNYLSGLTEQLREKMSILECFHVAALLRRRMSTIGDRMGVAILDCGCHVRWDDRVDGERPEKCANCWEKEGFALMKEYEEKRTCNS
jgi:hypothetical protein